MAAPGAFAHPNLAPIEIRGAHAWSVLAMTFCDRELFPRSRPARARRRRIAATSTLQARAPQKFAAETLFDLVARVKPRKAAVVFIFVVTFSASATAKEEDVSKRRNAKQRSTQQTSTCLFT